MGLILALLEAQAPKLMSVYVIPHQDDEVLCCGTAIMEEVAAGRQVVVMSTNRGENSVARTKTELVARLGYTPSKEEFSAARDREFSECVRRLGATPLVPPYELRQSDGFATGPAIAALVKGLFPPTVALRATGPTDYHVDHRACGDAVEQLAAEGWGTDHRLFISPYRMDSWPVGEPKNKIGEHGDVTTYHMWPYATVDVPNGWWGIGYLSSPAPFDHSLNIDGASYWHPPLV